MRCAMVSRAFILYLCCETTFRHLFVVSRRIYASISLPVPQCISIRFVCLFWFVSSTTTTTLWSFRNYHVRHFQRLLFCLKASHFSIIHFQDASHTHTHTHCQTERRCTTTHNTVNIVKYCAVCFLDLRKKLAGLMVEQEEYNMKSNDVCNNFKFIHSTHLLQSSVTFFAYIDAHEYMHLHYIWYVCIQI